MSEPNRPGSTGKGTEADRGETAMLDEQANESVTAKLRRLESAATAGPWFHRYGLADWEANKAGGQPPTVVVDDGDGGQRDILDDLSDADVAMVAAARNSLKSLLDVAEAFKKITSMCDSVFDPDDIGDCTFCGADLWNDGDHADDCPWGQGCAALTALDAKENNGG